MTNRIVPALLATILLASVTITGQSRSVQRVQSAPPSARLAEPWRPVTSSTGDTRIIGTVIDIRQVPVAHARVQLRNLITGQVAQHSRANENGEYVFIVEEPSTYVVEMAMVDGDVVALSNAGTLARYETLQTVVQLPGRWNSTLNTMYIPQNPVNFLGMSAATTMTAATLALAAEMNVAPVDAGEPVSPLQP
jgi:hypothetical protein